MINELLLSPPKDTLLLPPDVDHCPGGLNRDGDGGKVGWVRRGGGGGCLGWDKADKGEVVQGPRGGGGDGVVKLLLWSPLSPMSPGYVWSLCGVGFPSRPLPLPEHVLICTDIIINLPPCKA